MRGNSRRRMVLVRDSLCQSFKASGAHPNRDTRSIALASQPDTLIAIAHNNRLHQNVGALEVHDGSHHSILWAHYTVLSTCSIRESWDMAPKSWFKKINHILGSFNLPSGFWDFRCTWVMFSGFSPQPSDRVYFIFLKKLVEILMYSIDSRIRGFKYRHQILQNA